mmetsp:Transcript_25433/g.55287  ORF Transcript_25433/g.55287 Transcript_25433/m.55287 type:complete len:373 (-) Transcript_25433:473-1591(-)|eukprot:CAMPEP_0118931710 /NCGR_PEP_ID=MMETSP1169-20130426/7957_1 /TAXON_ID=36882 /ORGANISM="Pyramimonas obovata, Strain CCMP722" /LENGTH=372 /DNA_ID=CAMNT_0006874239 /DNA_START=91 /DNA_END=1209 /DNA_ORIENTATION=-
MSALASCQPLVASARPSLSCERGSNRTLSRSRQTVARTAAVSSLQNTRATRAWAHKRLSSTHGTRCRASADNAVTFTAEELAEDYKHYVSQLKNEETPANDESDAKLPPQDLVAEGKASKPKSKKKPSVQGTVVVTREKGKNGKLVKRLEEVGIKCIELPLIEHAPGKDRHKLGSTLEAKDFDWVIVTSPEGAKVFVEGWQEAGKPDDLKLAVVGGGTAQVIESRSSVPIAFVPSKATGKTMAAELPAKEGERVLYAASAKAGDDIQAGLESRGIQVVRLDTYTTRAVRSVSSDLLQQAAAADVVTFASPSTIKAWIQYGGEKTLDPSGPKAACIGETSASACKKMGIPNVFFPEKPGMKGWVSSVLEALAA